MSEAIIAVVGQTRSGTSLTMQMLAAGGCPIAPGSSWPGFEDERIFGLPDRADWLEDCRGRAVKLLDAHDNPPPFDGRFEYRAIILHRRLIREQAKSWRKMLNVTGIPASLHDQRLAIGSFRAGRVAIKRLPWHHTLPLSFEQLVWSPKRSSEQIASFVGLDLDIEAMARAVRPRPVTCLRHMLELELLEDERGAA